MDGEQSLKQWTRPRPALRVVLKIYVDHCQTIMNLQLFV